MNPRDRRRAFGVYFGRSYFKSPPLINPSGLIALAVPCLLLLAVVLIAAYPHLMAGAALLPLPLVGDIKEDLAALQKELKGFLDKAAEQQAKTGTITKELADKITVLQKQVDAIDAKLAERHAAAAPDKSLEETLNEDEGLRFILKP